MKQASKIIAWVLIVILLAGAVAAIWFFTDGGTEDFKTFMLTCDGEVVVNEKSTMRFKAGETHSFGVKYIFGSSKEEKRDYSVKVSPSPDADFGYTVNGTACAWRGAGDLTSLFVSEETADGFTIKLDGKNSVLAVLRSLYPGTEIVYSGAPAADALLYRLTVTSYNGKVTYTVDFSVDGGTTSGGGQEPGDEEPQATHAITVNANYGGSYWIEYQGPASARTGETVEFSFSIKADCPYQSCRSVTAETASGAPVELGFGDSGRVFTMPDDDVIIVIELSYR